MALSASTKSEIAFKKLVGVANTQFSNTAKKEFNEETIGSSFPVNSYTSFGETITGSTASGYTVSGTYIGIGLYTDTNGIYEKIRLSLSAITSSAIGAGLYQGYYGCLPNNYSTNNGKLTLKLTDLGLLNATDLNNYSIYDSLGKIQVIPKLYGNSYDYQLLNSSLAIINKTDNISWYFDSYNAILYVQNPSLTTIPSYVECYLYVGKTIGKRLDSGSSVPSYINNLPYDSSWSTDTVSGATRQAIYNKINSLDSTFSDLRIFTSTTSTRLTNLETFSANTLLNYVSGVTYSGNGLTLGSTNKSNNNLQLYTVSGAGNINITNRNGVLIFSGIGGSGGGNITGATNTNNTNPNTIISNQSTSTTIVLQTFSGTSGITINNTIDPNNMIFSLDYGSGVNQPARGNHTHNPLDLLYNTGQQSLQTIDFGTNNFQTRNLNISENIFITGFTNTGIGKTIVLNISSSTATIAGTYSTSYQLSNGNNIYGGTYVLGTHTFPNVTGPTSYTMNLTTGSGPNYTSYSNWGAGTRVLIVGPSNYYATGSTTSAPTATSFVFSSNTIGAGGFNTTTPYDVCVLNNNYFTNDATTGITAGNTYIMGGNVLKANSVDYNSQVIVSNYNNIFIVNSLLVRGGILDFSLAPGVIYQQGNFLIGFRNIITLQQISNYEFILRIEPIF
jgi:hypothetical protein